MNANKQRVPLILTASVILMALASCNNPAGPRSAFVPEPSTGIDADPATGLVAGLSLEGDAILTNPSVVEITDVDWTDGISGNAMSNDADGDFIRIADDGIPELDRAGTLEVWVNPNPNVAWAGILHKGQETDFSDEAWSLQYDGSKKPRFYVYSDTKSKYLTANVVLTENDWHHLAATWVIDESDDLTLKLYVDGVEAASAQVADFGSVKDSAGDLIIGSQLPDPLGGYGHVTFQGLLDEVSIYSVERSAEDIQAAYQKFATAP